MFRDEIAPRKYLKRHRRPGHTTDIEEIANIGRNAGIDVARRASVNFQEAVKSIKSTGMARWFGRSVAKKEREAARDRKRGGRSVRCAQSHGGVCFSSTGYKRFSAGSHGQVGPPMGFWGRGPRYSKRTGGGKKRIESFVAVTAGARRPGRYKRVILSRFALIVPLNYGLRHCHEERIAPRG